MVGIDASHYIAQHLNHHPTREPLLTALGGFPFALKNNIERELHIFKNLGVACVFVFNGLDFGKKDQRPRVQPESVRAFEQAWDLYDQQQADQVVDAFSGAGMVFLFFFLSPSRRRKAGFCSALTGVIRYTTTVDSLQVPPTASFTEWRGLHCCSLQRCSSGRISHIG